MKMKMLPSERGLRNNRYLCSPKMTETMKKIELDIHTHTIASGHAYSTLSEMIAEGQRKGLKILGITEHGEAIPGTCNRIYFRNLHVIPRQWGDMRLMLGAELNILDTKGTLDMNEDTWKRLDIRIAGIHRLCWTGGTVEENTAGMVAAIRNPWTHIISHPGDGTAELLFEPIVLAAKETHTLLEINSSTFRPMRHFPNARENNLEILRLCKQYDVPVILGSDAHFALDIANYEYCYPLLAETEFPDELIVNYDEERFLAYLGLQ